MNGRDFPYMGTLVRSCFSFGAHAHISPLGCGSHLYSTFMTLSKSFILLLTFMLAISPGLPCICQVKISLSWVLLALLSLIPASLTLIISHIAQACLISSHAEPFYISFATWFPIFTRRGLSPKCRYPTHVSLHWALSIGISHPLVGLIVWI